MLYEKIRRFLGLVFQDEKIKDRKKDGWADL